MPQISGRNFQISLTSLKNMSTDHELRYPLGRFSAPAGISEADLSGWIAEIERLPTGLRQAVAGLTDEQLDTPYRPGGWTVRQVVHHLPDSHLNAYGRFRLALTEENPTIKPYKEAAWAELPDAKTSPIAPSLDLLTALHLRWVALLRSLSTDQWSRTFRHPELGERRLDTTAGLYAWHSRHHLAHVTNLKQRQGW
jgi:hypothetical protein